MEFIPFCIGEIMKNKFDFIYLDTVDSTNTYARKIIEEKNINNTVIIAETQTNGRGRVGRSFYSPCNNGIYMSVIKEVNCPLNKLNMVTVETAVCVSYAIDSIINKKTGIKWVNDIFLDGKKVCGILVESVNDLKTGIISHIIIGIGINVKDTDDFPLDIKDIAGAINIGLDRRNELITAILNELDKFLLKGKNLIEDYRKKSILINNEILYLKNNKEYSATVIDINDNGNLVVLNENKDEEIIHSGEIRIRKIK